MQHRLSPGISDANTQVRNCTIEKLGNQYRNHSFPLQCNKAIRLTQKTEMEIEIQAVSCRSSSSSRSSNTTAEIVS